MFDFYKKNERFAFQGKILVKKMIILSKSLPNIKVLFSGLISHNKTYNNLFYFRLGRDALISGLSALGLIKNDTIIVPAYICNSVVQKLTYCGFKVVFVDVDSSLAIQLESIKKIATQGHVKALLIIHYFGFIKDLTEICNYCQKFNIKIIEDYSHSFLSQPLLKSEYPRGDMELFSMRKSLPIVDGGAIRFNTDRFTPINIADEISSGFINDTKYLLLRFIEKYVAIFGLNIYGGGFYKPSLNSYEVGCDLKSYKPSWQLHRYLNNDKYLDEIKHRIDRNFSSIVIKIESMGYTLFVKYLPIGTIPQAIVIIDNEGGLKNFLRANGVGAWSWPDGDIPAGVSGNVDMYPISNFMNSKLVLLPIHQNIKEEHIQYMLDKLSQWLYKDRR